MDDLPSFSKIRNYENTRNFIPNFGPSPGLCQRRATSPGNGPVSHLYLEGHPASRKKKASRLSLLKNRGYKILAGDLLIPQVIEDLSPLTVTYNPQCQSTQLDAKNAMEAGGQSATLYLAPFQTAGKGRFGRDYFCPSQGGIYMSLHLKPNLPFDQAPCLYPHGLSCYLQGSEKI